MRQKTDYINDPYFFQWIFQSDELSEAYWADYIKKYPAEKETIVKLKEELSFLKLKNEDLSYNERTILWKNILQEKFRQNTNEVHKLRRSQFLKYAAIAVICLVLGNLIMYFFLTPKKNQIKYADLEYSVPVHKPKLILSDGSHIRLKKESTIQYLKEDKVVVDDKFVDVEKKKDREVISNQLIIPSGSTSKIILSDSTVVYLNAGSKLVYPSEFKGKTREVLLFGEAYFEVRKNPDKAFIVRTSSLSVEALGTIFNVSSYSEDDIVQTVLVEGQVAVKRNNAPFFERSVIMSPGQLTTYSKETKVMNTTTVDTEYYTIWKDGMLKFENMDLNRVIKKIERYYDVSINFKNPLDGGVKISGKLGLSDNRYEVFEYLSTLTKMEFVEINDKYYIMK